MNWGAYVQPAGFFPMHSQRLSVVTSFPAGTLAIEEALGRKPTAVLLGFPYYERGGKVYYWPKATARIRRRFYRLAVPSLALSLVDMGDLFVPEPTPEKVASALEEVSAALLRQGHTIVLFGGGQEAAHPLYRALAAQEAPFTYTLIDKKLDLFDAISAEEAPHRRYHSSMLLDEELGVPTWGQVIGLAWHWVSPEEESLIHERLNLLYVRLHEVLSNPDRAEPLLRMASLISMDLGVLRGADAPAVLDPEPEGLPIEIAAKLMRFAGMGYRSEVLHIANYFAPRDPDGRSAAAVAILLWYFLEGRINPQDDFPQPDRSNLERYEVSLSEPEPSEVVFYRHPLTGRWWMEVVPLTQGHPPRLFPCTQEDYQQALGGELPRLWYVASWRI